MKTILLLAQHPGAAEALRAALDPQRYRVLVRMEAEHAEPLLLKRMVDFCVVDVEDVQIQGLWLIEKIRKWAPHIPLVVYTGPTAWEWEEEAFLQGVAQMLRKPIRPRMLNAILDRLQAVPHDQAAAHPTPAPRPSTVLRSPIDVPSNPQRRSHSAFEALGVLRDFTTVLTHSLCAEAMLKEFLLRLREILGVNRAVIFVRRPTSLFGKQLMPEESRRLRSACAIGLSAGLLEHFELSFETGIGGYLFRQGRILRRESPEASADSEMQKEFELLGVEVAIPMLDREHVIGVAAFDGRVTGEPLANGELELIFHLLEELALAVKNIWLHDQLVANHEMMADILRELSSACVVVNHDLAVLHANRMARSYFGRPNQRGADLEFSDLPMQLGSKIFQVLRTGAALAPFKYQDPDEPNTIYQVSIIPFQHAQSATPNSALLVVEDHSREQHLQRLEIETANLRLIKSMADRLAHEIGNALVPMSTHQQLLDSQYKDPEFRVSLKVAMADSVKRISRLTNQMRFLARDEHVALEPLELSALLQEAFQEARQYFPHKSAELHQDSVKAALRISGDRAALKHALAEVMLNAIQANPESASVAVRTQEDPTSNGSPRVQIDVQDNGSGFTSEAFEKASQPFYTTRSVGLGLGLAVSRKIVETHQGRLDIVAPKAGQAGVVRITLPMAITPVPAAGQGKK